MRTVIDPRGMSVIEWFDRTTQLFDDIFPPMKINTEEEWTVWAEAANRVIPPLPDPDDFTWHGWAERFNLVMGGT